MGEVRDHSLREELLLLLSLLLLPQRLQLGVTQLRLPSVSSNALKTADELLLSLRGTAPHVQRPGMPTKKIMSSQPLEVLLLPGNETDLRPAATDTQPVSALEIRVIGLRLCETIRMRVKYVLMVLQLLDPVSKELA